MDKDNIKLTIICGLIAALFIGTGMKLLHSPSMMLNNSVEELNKSIAEIEKSLDLNESSKGSESTEELEPIAFSYLYDEFSSLFLAVLKGSVLIAIPCFLVFLIIEIVCFVKSSRENETASVDEVQVSFNKMCKSLYSISMNLQDESLQSAVVRLIELIEINNDLLNRTSYMDVYIEGLIKALEKYTVLDNMKPEGYGELLECIDMLIKAIQTLTKEEYSKKELDFSSDVKALLEIAKMNNL